MKKTDIYVTKLGNSTAHESLNTIFFPSEPLQMASEKVSIPNALALVKKQLQIEGLRSRTIEDYCAHFHNFTTFAKVRYLSDIKQEHIYNWLGSMNNNSDATRLIRLKSLKAVLNRLFDRGYFPTRFWKTIRIRSDQKKKQPIKSETLNAVFSVLDMTDYFQFRDAVAILLMYRTGIRITTLAQLKEEHLDLIRGLMVLSGDITKNRQMLTLPLDSQLCNLLQELITANKRIRTAKDVENTFIFITKSGNSIYRNGKTNAIQKRMHLMAQEYGFKDFTPHALRRAYAYNLYKKGATVPVISGALGHRSLEVTSRYLDISSKELIDNLRTLF